MTLQHVHSGGFFWAMERAGRDRRILQLAADVKKLLMITSTDSQARSLAERLTLSGLPTLLGIESQNRTPVETYMNDQVSSLVATHHYVMNNGPITAPLVVHSRLAPSTRDYTRRLLAAEAPVHITFVMPEDESSATTLLGHIGKTDVIDLDEGQNLEAVLDLTDGDSIATVSGGRRRFPLHR